MLIDAAGALSEGDAGRARALIEDALQSEPLRRAARRAPKTLDEMVPILQRRDKAGPVLRQLRKAFGLTQEQMAVICGERRDYLASVEVGRFAMRKEAIEKLILWAAERGVQKMGDGPQPVALAALRKMLGLTQRAMASKLGMKEPVLRVIEKGERVITLDIAERYRKLASEHNIVLDQLAA